jgi:hypothetical protein
MVFPRQQLLHEHTPKLLYTYIVCVVVVVVVILQVMFRYIDLTVEYRVSQ